MAKPLFELKDVYFSYMGKFPALCGVNLTIEEGAKVCVIGANGTGKSTILNMLDGLIFAGSGSMKAFDRNITSGVMSEAGFSRVFRKSVGFVFQNPDAQLFCPSVKEDIMFGPLQLGVQLDKIKKGVDIIANRLKINNLLNRQPHQLSIGEKKKVSIACVMAVEPDVFLLDEPTAGLDPATTRDIIDILLEENMAGKTIVTATHDMHIVGEISDIAHVLGRNKKIIRSAVPDEILLDCEFLKDNNLVHVHRHMHDGRIHAHPHLHTEHH
ncbi:MAG: nickel ABC transporter ATP-binding protein [Candidatus Omnitrophica bacterium CG12_big_fil_rev_8_21_14_0_65_43_15]|uniref:Nickel ABC transporter ATP-binding protein n=1 Tax=Candidatus Taenaricola geysiri TaxID=1974752 RepID=A0A2J0LDN6_9BACT|nr:MAG: nickel ABC transporter ATP-binding protein [Candidatus Omnitrophica bacterium CG10_big_fil_rev_8_21_14_0_10_43_8]PIV12376.1 MAG: nickel ABC transporter ATP-binding protein [Candidatus Omnitrophica bacterium CG03_land_8_20_14_0_80_43_22]PIW65962.1 MAG: nickel ABC transporter ATP-binding protein [Candidatus Omnitrophica bacterium CG12_big_fil_rev_8_21_14_0_65_43_15]